MNRRWSEVILALLGWNNQCCWCILSWYKHHEVRAICSSFSSARGHSLVWEVAHFSPTPQQFFHRYSQDTIGNIPPLLKWILIVFVPIYIYYIYMNTPYTIYNGFICIVTDVFIILPLRCNSPWRNTLRRTLQSWAAMRNTTPGTTVTWCSIGPIRYRRGAIIRRVEFVAIVRFYTFKFYKAIGFNPILSLHSTRICRVESSRV